MDTITISVQMDTGEFIKWLLDYCARKHREGKQYPYLNGQGCRFNYPFFEHLTHFLPDMDRLSPIGADFEGSESAVLILWKEVNGIMRVTVQNIEEQWAFYPVIDLLTEFWSVWPDTRKDIEEHVRTKAEEYHIPLTELPLFVKKPKQPHGARPGTMHLETREKLSLLRKYRTEEIRDRGRIPTKKMACVTAKIDPKTWKTYDHELWIKWDSKNYEYETENKE